MADLENGYTRIANEILESLAKIKLSSIQYRLILVIWRYTYGFQRKEHSLSLKFLQESTGYDKRQIQRELKKLEEMKLIKQSVKSGKTRKIKFNKKINEWVVTIDETTNGKSTNGKTTNGNFINSTVDDFTNGTVDDFTNQERKKEKYKEIYMEKSALADKAEILVQLLNSIFPDRQKKYGTGGNVKAYDTFLSALEGNYDPEIMFDTICKLERDTAPWNIVKMCEGRSYEKTYEYEPPEKPEDAVRRYLNAN